MNVRSSYRRKIGAAALAAAAVLVTACSSSTKAGDNPASNSASGPSTTTNFPAVTVDLGGGHSVKYPASTSMRIVFLNFGSGFSYTAAIVKGAQARAAKLGITLDVDDAQVQPEKQVQQLQDAIASGKYVGGFVLPIAESLLCDLATKAGPAKNFMVVETNAPLCGREKNDGAATWAPGSLAFVSAEQEIGTFKAWGDYIQQHNPGKQKVIALLGPEQVGESQNANAALKQIQAAHPEFQIVDTVYTNFSSPDALTKMQDALQAHPDATVVASIYSELTKPTVTVVKQLGLQGKVKIYDVGADSTVLPLIDSGAVQMTYPYYPVTMGATAVQALYDARMGKKVTRFYPYSGHDIPTMQGSAPLLFVTKDNLAQFKSAGLSEY